ncbi:MULTISPECIES: O-antigen translocase [Pseudomonas]|uniref:O-antigen translocase n=1 Tax=Pseudomonas sp. W17 TaxID=3144407 RepID=A0AAU7WQA5_9PSED|nr:O-antigen translocase [Pseudomonas protegens]WRV89925.1 O-antigen translocase [Pseudomonas protegens]BAO63759.1 membrane protein [Pseudomonas protegens Cab57]
MHVASNASRILVSRKHAFQSAALTVASQTSKIAVGFILIKLIAVYLGAGGMGLLGNFMSLVAMLSLMAGGGISNGVIKYVAEYKKQPRRLAEFIGSAKLYSLLFCTFFCIVGVCFSRDISGYIFKSEEYYKIIVFLFFAQFGFAFVNLVCGVANGLRDTKTYALIQISGNVLVVPISWFLIGFYQLVGAAISMVLMFLIYSIPAYFFYRRSFFFRAKIKTKINALAIRRLSVFTSMALVGAVSVPLIEILVRQQIINHIGYASAGIWQGAIKVSSAYMGFFTIFLAVYFMPTISGSNNRKEIASLVLRFMAVVMFVFLFGASIFFLLRVQIIPIILSSEFESLESLIKYQLIADFFRVSTYVIGFVVIAKAALKIYIVSELLQGIFFFSASSIFLNLGLGLKGVFLATLLMNIVYFVVAVSGFFLYRRREV